MSGESVVNETTHFSADCGVCERNADRVSSAFSTGAFSGGGAKQSGSAQCGIADPCPNGIVALYDKNASLEELANAVTERYGSPLLKGDMPGGTWKVASKNLVIDVYPLADEPSPEAQPVPEAMKGDPVTYFFTTDAYHNLVDRSVPRKELKELIFLAMFNTSCGVRVDKPK